MIFIFIALKGTGNVEGKSSVLIIDFQTLVNI